MNKIWIIIIGLGLCLPSLSIAQNDKDQMKKMSEEAIRSIKEGVLIVRLESLNKRKLAQKVDRYPEKDEENKKWIQTFRDLYTFGDVLFVYDTTSKAALLMNDGFNCFLNDSLEIDSSIALNGRSFGMAFFGRNNNNESLSFKNHNFKTLDSPFPTPRNLNHPLGYLITRAFTKDDPEKKNMERILRKLNTRFFDYYNKIN